MTFLQNIIFAFWFFLPAGLANMFPIFAAHTPGLRRLDAPMDFGWSFQDKRILGENKTWRGFAVAIFIGILVAVAEKEIFAHWHYLQTISPLDYSQINPMMLGFLLGLGAIMGDAVESFFKRQLGIGAGSSWLVFDQLDFIAGAILVSYWYAPLSLVQYLYIIAVYFLLHLVSTILGFFLGLKHQAI